MNEWITTTISIGGLASVIFAVVNLGIKLGKVLNEQARNREEFIEFKARNNEQHKDFYNAENRLIEIETMLIELCKRFEKFEIEFRGNKK